MISAPQSVQDEWKYIEENRIGCPPAFWIYWKKNWLPSFNSVSSLLKISAGENMSVSKAHALNLLTKDLRHFLDFQRNNESDQFKIDKTIKSLMTHYINNSLHKIGFMAYVGGSMPEPISPENVSKIVISVNDMADFWDRLRRIKPSWFQIFKRARSTPNCMKFSKMIVVMMTFVGLTSTSIAEGLVAVTIGKAIKIDYTLTVNNEEVESSIGKKPLQFVVGDKAIIPGLERGIEGLKVGDERVIEVEPKDAYGEVDPKAVKEFPRNSMPTSPQPKVGMVLQAKAPNGESFPAVIKEINGNKVVLDFNHPLAGKKLIFKVKILDVANTPGMLAATPSPKTQAAKKCEGAVGGAEWTACMGLK